MGERIRAHLSIDPAWDRLTLVEFGSVWDDPSPERVRVLADDGRVAFLLRAQDGPAIGVTVDEPHDLDPEAIDAPEVWDAPRFEVPALGLRSACVGEVLLAVRARYAKGEPTVDAAYFHLAVSAGAEGDRELAEQCWRRALEAGDMKAHFGLGYTLCDLGRPREAYDHLRAYTELTPRNAWAWCWLGRACEELGERREAIAAYRTAIEVERAGGTATDALRFLGALLEAGA